MRINYQRCNTFIVFVLVTNFLCLFSVAQDKSEKGRAVKILYLQSGSNAPAETYVHTVKGEAIVTPLPRSNFSKTFYIPKGDTKLAFTAGALEEDEEVPAEAPSVLIPASWEKALLLVFKDDKNVVMPIRVQAINASSNHFKKGSMYMINYSKVILFGTLDTKKLVLKPESTQIFEYPGGKNGYYPVKLDAKVKGEKRNRRFIRQMWSYGTDIRHLLFVIPKKAPIHATYYCAPIRDF